MDWAAWGPTIVSLISCIFFAGVLYSKQSSNSERLDVHDGQLNDHTKDLTSHAVKIGMLESWRDGYAAARAAYEQRRAQLMNSGPRTVEIDNE
jgi:archaellum component FlaF (FlaF/FlaG flagellin family)